MLQIVAERLQVVFAREVALLARPLRDRVDDAADELLDAALTLRRLHLAAEILRDDDVGGLLRPEAGDLDVALLEDHLALLVADDGRPDVPLYLVERIDPFMAEIPDKVQTGRGLRSSLDVWSTLPWWCPPAEQRLSAYFPSENAEPADQPPSRLTPKTYNFSLEARTRLVG